MKSRNTLVGAALRGALPLLLTLSLSLPAGGEEPPSRSLDEVLASTMETNEAMGIAVEDVLQAESQKKRYLMSLTPDISLSAYRRRIGSTAESEGEREGSGPNFFPEGTRYGYNLSFTQPLFTGGRALAAYRGAGDQESSLVLQEELTRRDLLVAATEAYYGVLATMETVRISEQAVVRAERHLELADKRLELGEGLMTDKLRAEVNLADVTGDVTRFRNFLADARDAVHRISGRPLAKDPAGAVRLEEITGTVDSLIAEALKTRLEREQDQLGIQAAEEDVKEKKGRFFPIIYFNANYYGSGERIEEQDDGWDAGVFLEFPLYQSASRHFLLKESKSSLRQAQLRENARAKDIALEVSRLYNALEASGTRVTTLRKQVELAGENVRLAEKRFSVGLADSLETVDAQTALLDAEVKLTAEVLTFEVAKLRLYLALGREIFPQITLSSARRTRSR
jgi:outer membrane protein TolC